MAAVRLATFAALALFAGAHWIGLVDSPPAGRIVLVVVISTCTAALLLALGAPAVRARVHGAVIAAAAVAIGLIGIVLALGAIGLPLRLIGPNNWDELSDGLDRGLAGVQTVEWPYRGSDYWVRLTTLMGGPLLIALAAAVAFFPARRGTAALSWAGLVLLLLAYGSAVTEKDPGAPLLRGLALLVLVGAWLWLPRLGPREALAGAGLVLALGALSLPVAAALDGDKPWWNYGAWTWLENDRAITFDWNHRYGPLDWPRDGTTLLNVKSGRPHYWKTETLDTFDGIRWVRGGTSDSMHELQGVPDATSADRHWDYFEWNRKWDAELDFTVRSLSTDLLVSAGTPYLIDGAGLVSTSGDGTTRLVDQPLGDGDTYRVRTYDPNPTARQMRERAGRLLELADRLHGDRPPAPGARAASCRPTRPTPAARRCSCLSGAARTSAIPRRRGGSSRARRTPACSTSRPSSRPGRRRCTTPSSASSATSTATSATARSRATRSTRSTRSCSATSSATASSSRARWR